MDHTTDWRQTEDYPTDLMQAALHGPPYRLETGCSTWTIIQTGDRLLNMDYHTVPRQAALHGLSYTLETDRRRETNRTK